jgi:hypothetical protein
MSAMQLYAVEVRIRDGATGLPIVPPAGYTFQSDGAGHGVWANVVIPVAPPAPIVNFAEFLHDNTTDNAPIAVGAPFRFGSAPGPASTGTTITQLSPSRFPLGPIGKYRVTWDASVTEAGQMALALSDLPVPAVPTEVARTRRGRATGTSQIIGNLFIQTTFANARLELWNSSGSAAALTPTPNAGGAAAAWTNITIQQVE